MTKKKTAPGEREPSRSPHQGRRKLSDKLAENHARAKSVEHGGVAALVEADLKKELADIEIGLEEVVTEVGQRIFDRSQELVPVDTGRLKASGFMEKEHIPHGVRVTIGYSKDGAPPYGLFVHENLEARHKPPTQAKFLEAAAQEVIKDVPNIIKRRIP